MWHDGPLNPNGFNGIYEAYTDRMVATKLTIMARRTVTFKW